MGADARGNCSNVEPAELELLDQVLRGDRGAWEKFCSRYESLIVGCVLRVLRRYSATFTSADLADFVSEVWLALLRDDQRKLRLYEPTRGYRVSSWIGLIATNCTIDQLRSRQGDLLYLDDLSLPERVMVDNDRPDQGIELRQAADVARQAFGRLSDEEQDFVLWCYRDERAPVEVAEELGVSVNTVYSRKFKVRQKLVRFVGELCNGLEPTELAA